MCRGKVLVDVRLIYGNGEDLFKANDTILEKRKELANSIRVFLPEKEERKGRRSAV